MKLFPLTKTSHQFYEKPACVIPVIRTAVSIRNDGAGE